MDLIILSKGLTSKLSAIRFNLNRCLILLFLLFTQNVYAETRGDLFFKIVDDESRNFQNSGIDTFIVFGFAVSDGKNQSFSFLYQKDGRYFRRFIVYNEKKFKQKTYKIVNDFVIEDIFFKEVFDFINKNFEETTNQVDHVNEVFDQVKIENGRRIVTEAPSHFGSLFFYLSIHVKDKKFADNLMVQKPSFINKLYATRHCYWVLCSMLNNL